MMFTKHIGYSIDISRDLVRLVKTNRDGAVVGAACVMVMPPDLVNNETSLGDDYTDALVAAVRKASRAAGVPLGFGIPAVVVTGDSNVIIRRFTWPDMPALALVANAQTEIAPYLPGDADDYVISQEVLRRTTNDGGKIPVMDVMVCAILKEDSRAITTAVRGAGYKVIRLDIRENVRNRLVAKCLEALPGDTASYAVLDLGGKQINMAIYLDGLFYSNRYFASPGLPADYDLNALSNEIASIIDYVNYRERGASINRLLLVGEDKYAEIESALSGVINIPIHKTLNWLDSGIFGQIPKKPGPASYLDAYAAGLPTKTENKHRLNLTFIRRTPTVPQLLRPVVGTFLMLGIILYFGITIPAGRRAKLEVQEHQLIAQHLAMTDITNESDLLIKEINAVTRHIHTVDDFFKEFPQARAMIPVIFGSGLSVSGVDASGGLILLQGNTEDFNRIAAVLEYFRDNALIEESTVQTARNINTHRHGEAANFSVMLNLLNGTGER